MQLICYNDTEIKSSNCGHRAHTQFGGNQVGREQPGERHALHSLLSRTSKNLIRDRKASENIKLYDFLIDKKAEGEKTQKC